MKKHTLLQITTRSFLIILVVVLIPWTVLFYFQIRSAIYHTVDEYLDNRKFEIIRETTHNPALLNIYSGRKTDFELKPVASQEAASIKDKHSDTQVFEPLEQELEPYRKLETTFSHANQPYKLTIFASLTDSRKLLSILLRGVIILFTTLMVVLLIINRLVLQRVWRPFHATLQKIHSYRLDSDASVVFEDTRIHEFSELHEALSQWMSQAHQTYQQQKQFTENASHELQTPLAIARNQIELLIEDPLLSTSQANSLQLVEQSLSRMSRLNKTLLLLAKIDNKQFPVIEAVDVVSLTRRLLDELSEVTSYKELTIQVEVSGVMIVAMNPDLAEIFFGNLIRNAIFHNIRQGYLNISFNSHQFHIENSGIAYHQDPVRLFERFAKGSETVSSGLGLSLVQSIGKLYGFTIQYTVRESTHQIDVSL
ncbi:HAMP domain-containing sensor histidine kinase [Cytophagaceae bacterium YF14B1]|uniref:histidine kinase n=1 Tax=Xanthocytophaga flava TaxID=3048013 RepID=A0AAE3QZL0_9BACT|nr:HAMP domain-containing sensor histidine kinase [Xanthocytophaga flavus]MDJ1485634.1 HAMP domain-containing sensor histidine kinase [Xanthocytophaga flavus]